MVSLYMVLYIHTNHQALKDFIMSNNSSNIKPCEDFNAVKRLLMQAIQGYKVDRISTDFFLQDRPFVKQSGISIDGLRFKHILDMQIRSNKLEIELPIYLNIEQQCLLDSSDAELASINIVSSFENLSIDHDLYDEGGFSITLFDSSIIDLFNKALGLNDGEGFIKDKPRDIGRNHQLTSEKDTKSYRFFNLLVDEINSLMVGDINDVNFKLFTDFKKCNDEGVKSALDNFKQLASQMSL